mgnify:CR=1 FL=1
MVLLVVLSPILLVAGSSWFERNVGERMERRLTEAARLLAVSYTGMRSAALIRLADLRVRQGRVIEETRYTRLDYRSWTGSVGEAEEALKGGKDAKTPEQAHHEEDEKKAEEKAKAAKTEEAQAAEETAQAELARRYFSAYGPATPDDLASWSGLPVGQARTACGERRRTKRRSAHCGSAGMAAYSRR